jgi:putative ABC transport system permease protein
MTTRFIDPSPDPLPANGGAPARRAVVHWAWRLFRREWHQQLLILALVVIAVAAAFIGAAVATNTPAPSNAGFGTAEDAATFSGPTSNVSTQIASLQRRFGRVDVIENTTLTIRGSINTYDLRAQNPHGAFGLPMLALVAGLYPETRNEVAVTRGVASDFGLDIGASWREAGRTRQVVGIVENPQDFLDEFALVVPGQVTAPTEVTVLFDAPGVDPSAIGPNVTTPASLATSSSLNPETISLAVLTIGMILIALVAVGGFTVLAQRRLRSLGMLSSIGAADEHVSLVVRANGAVVGVVGALVGTLLGFVAWLAYRPQLERGAEHVVGVFALPWTVVGLGILLAILATYIAASRPARSLTKMSIVAALSGRPAPPKQVHRSVVPGIALFVVAFVVLGFSGSASPGSSAKTVELVVGIVALIPGVILVAPFGLALLGRLARRAPVAMRLALRDLARYRARSGSVLAAISIGVMIAVIITVAAAARYGDVFDYAGPNLALNQLIVHNQDGSQGAHSKTPTAIAAALGAQRLVTLESSNAFLVHPEPPYEGFGGSALYVATPQVLRAFGISASQVNANADILTVRPGLSSEAGIVLTGCKTAGPPMPHTHGSPPLSPLCSNPVVIKNPVIQEVGALPTGTSAPNIVITEHALDALGIQSTVKTLGWLIETPHVITGAQIHNAEAQAAATGLSIESKSDQPSSSQVIDWATVFGIAMALCILAMSVGLVRSETAGELRTLAATGASGTTRRTITAATAGALGLLGAVFGTVAGYVGVIGWFLHNAQSGGLMSLANVPARNLLIIVVGMPLAAICVGWLAAGRQPPAMARQAIE